MYTIYKGLKPDGTWKIGCDQAYPNRSIQQSLTEYFAIEEHEDIMIASHREIELQKEHGVKVDKSLYYQSVQRGRRGARKRGDSPNNNFKNYTKKEWQFINKDKGGHLKKLTYQQAKEIRAKYTGKRGQQAELAREYGVTTRLMCNLINNKTYIKYGTN